MIPQRHHLMYLEPQADFTITSLHEDNPTIRAHVKAWITKGLPCIYARQVPHQEMIHLGLPLWYADKKHRVCLRVMPSMIQKQQPLPQLVEMHSFFLQKHGIQGLSSLTEHYHIANIGVYGSFLFHYLSGQFWVTDTSDLDLLIPYQGFSVKHLRSLIAGLGHKFERTIDGEVRFQSLGEVPIKELLDLSTQKLLCKTRDGVALILRAELYEHYSLL